MSMTHEKVSNTPEGESSAVCFGPDGSARLVQRALVVLGGRWKLTIVFHLFAIPTLRFSELERSIPGISQKMLAQSLRDLELDGVISRSAYAEIPPRVDYRLTAEGESLRSALRMLRDWSAAAGAHLGRASIT